MTQPFTNAVISDSTTISSRGTYGVVTPGVTLTLANWTSWKKLGSIRIKDLTGQSSLSITPPRMKGALSQDTARLMVFKLVMAASRPGDDCKVKTSCRKSSTV